MELRVEASPFARLMEREMMRQSGLGRWQLVIDPSTMRYWPSPVSIRTRPENRKGLAVEKTIEWPEERTPSDPVTW
jgi:hypothetical protein